MTAAGWARYTGAAVGGTPGQKEMSPPGGLKGRSVVEPVSSTEQQVRAWLLALQECVRRQDYAAARPLFAPTVVAFGTAAALVAELAALEEAQWRRVWPTITDFTFDLARLRWGESGDLVWAAVPWTSRGRRPDGTLFPRPGRATLIFQRAGQRLQAIHSHFSLAPALSPPP